MQALQLDQYYTYEDYLKWDEPYELFDGVPYLMAPAPTRFHQEVNVELTRQLANFLHGKVCKVYTAPFDVRLNEESVCQPDITVVCDQTKLDDRGCNGAPDMIIEILSPTSIRMDTTIKFKHYLKAGVREYWIVDPDTKSVIVYLLELGKYTATTYEENDGIAVTVLEGCVVDLKKVFDGI